jgi:hypothetical protein
MAKLVVSTVALAQILFDAAVTISKKHELESDSTNLGNPQ